ncbi:MAG: aryl-sulfate sulfotransferase [Bacilli bacterium]|nr:aryl-sulfate sulfotransferase [Bacilli bacterium]
MAKSKKNTKKINNNKSIIIAIAMIAVAIIIVIVYFLFINDKTKIQDKVKVDPAFAWTLDGLEQEVDTYDIYAHQDEVWQGLMNRYNKEKPDLNNAIVQVDPYEISPQTAIILFKTKKAEKVTLTIKGKHDDDITRTFESSKDHFIPVYGLYGNYENEVTIKTESGASKVFKIKIEKGNPEAYTDEGEKIDVVEKNELGNTNGEFYFGTSSLASSTIAYDNYGEIRWYLTLGYSKGMTMLKNGNMLLSSYSLGPDVTSTGGVVEIDMFGRVVHEYTVEGGYHHDAYEMPNGNLVILTSDLSSDSIADYIVELDRETGEVVKDWSVRKIVDEIDSNISSTYITWGWINSIYYDEANNAFILSLRNSNAVMSLGYETKKINWILSDKKYWSDKFNDLLLTPKGDNFSYTHGQHSVKFVDGYLSVFDNGYDAYREAPMKCSSLKGESSYAKVYKIDADNKTAELTWSYGGQDFFSYALSSFNYTPEGHKLITSGWHFTDKVKYDDPECTQFTNDQYDAFVIELDENNKEVLKLHLNESKFEVVKADIYNLSNASVRPENKDELKNYGPTYAKATDTHALSYEEISRDEALSYKDAEDMLFPVYANNGYLGITTALGTDTKIDVLFMATTGNAYKFTVRNVGEDTDRQVCYYNLPKGQYRVFVVINGYKYDTLQYVKVK